jgi:hypothetical protein
MDGKFGMHKGEQKYIHDLITKSEVKRTLERSRPRWNYITKKDRKEIKYQSQQMYISVGKYIILTI